MALVRGNLSETPPVTVKSVQIHSGVPCDFINRYLKYRQQDWNNSRVEQTRAAVTSTINGIANYCLGSKLIADIPQERQTACDKLFTRCTLVKTPADTFKLIDELGKEALDAGSSSSLFFRLAHALRSFYVGELKIQCPSVYQEEINAIKKNINELHEKIIIQGTAGNDITVLQEEEFSLKLRLIYLEDLPTIIEEMPYLKSHFTFPSTNQILPNGKMANRNYPFELQKEFIESFYNEAPFLKNETKVSYRSYIKNPSKYALKNAENMPSSDSDDDVEQDDFDQLIEYAALSNDDKEKTPALLSSGNHFNSATSAAYKGSLRASGSNLLAPSASSGDSPIPSLGLAPASPK